MLRNLYLTAAFILLSTSLFAQQRSRQEMEMIASQKLDLSITRSSNIVEPIEILAHDEMYSILGRKRQGFVVVSNERRHKPILAYSLNNVFDPDNIPCGMRWWLEAMSVSLKKAKSVGDLSLLPSPRRDSKTRIEPLMTTTWDQEAPFNKKCPTFDKKTAPTGCVATALAQILCFHKYPNSSEGTGFYTKGESDIKFYDTINSSYDWTLFKDSYKNAFFISEAEKEAVAQLMYDCGLAVHMHYTMEGSGAVCCRAGNALGQHFKCDSLGIRALYRDYYDTEEWLTIIRQELEEGRPILYAGQGSSEGHAFVFHGIDEEDMVYVNWGWSGSGDGWFNIDNLQGYNDDQSMVVGLKKQATPDSEEIYQSFWGLVDQVKISQTFKPAKSFSVSAFTAFNKSHLQFYGSIGIYMEKTDGSDKLFIPFLTTGEDMNDVECGWGYNVALKNITSTDLEKLSAGNYYVYIASNALQDVKPQAMKYKGGLTDVYFITIAEDRQLTIVSVEAVKNVIPTAIKTINVLSPDMLPVRYYDLQGHEVSRNLRGLLIRKQGDNIRKILIK